jgi:hypothetical protein
MCARRWRRRAACGWASFRAVPPRWSRLETAGQVDFTITNASPARQQLLDFTPPLVSLELGYLALPGSPVQALAEVDRPGIRICRTLRKQFRTAAL